MKNPMSTANVLVGKDLWWALLLQEVGKINATTSCVFLTVLPIVSPPLYFLIQLSSPT